MAPKIVVSGVRNPSHALLNCIVTDVPAGARMSIPAILDNNQHVAVGINSYPQYDQLAKVNVDFLTVYNGAARLAFKSPPSNLPSIIHRLELMTAAFFANVDAIKHGEAHDCPAVVFVDIAPGLFTSAGVIAYVSDNWAIGGNFDMRAWHLVVPLALHECFADLCTSMPNIHVWENVQQALGFRATPPPLTMTVNVPGIRALSLKSDVNVGASSRKRHDGSFEVTNLQRHGNIAFQLLVTCTSTPIIDVQLDGVPIVHDDIHQWVPTAIGEWDAEFAFQLASRKPSPSCIVKSLLLDLSAESGSALPVDSTLAGYYGGGATMAAHSSLARSASTYGRHPVLK